MAYAYIKEVLPSDEYKDAANICHFSYLVVGCDQHARGRLETYIAWLGGIFGYLPVVPCVLEGCF